VFFMVNVSELLTVYLLSKRPLQFENPIVNFKKEEIPSEFKEQYQFGCYNPILSYSGAYYHTQTSAGDVNRSSNSAFFNMNDVKKIFGPDGKGGYYKDHDWPLWPKTDADDFYKFIRFKQVVPLPLHVRVLNKVSLFVWILFLCGAVWILFSRFAKKPAL